MQKPTVIFRRYASDSLSAPMFGPVRLELGAVAMTREGCSIEAKAPSLNLNRTGRTYSLEDFPMLRGLL